MLAHRPQIGSLDHWPDLSSLAAAVRGGRSTARAETAKALDTIAALNPRLNAMVSVDAEDALARAAAVDRRVAEGEIMPLAGVPVAIKDNIWVKGRKVTQGSRLFRDFVAPEDAVAANSGQLSQV